MRLHVNKLLIAGFLSYIGYEIYLLYSFCQPPLDPAGVTWDLLRAPPVDIRIFLATTKSAPPSGKHALVGQFEAVEPASSTSKKDIVIQQLNLPKSFYKHKPISLHAVVVANRTNGPGSEAAPPLRWHVDKISRFVLQKERRVSTRYLLKGLESSNISNKEGDAKAVASLPRSVEVGFVQELRSLETEGLKEKGYGQYLHGREIRLPLYINTLVSPRDEYVSLGALNGSAKEPEGDGIGLELRLRNVGLAFWTLQNQISMGLDEAEKNMGLNEYDVDSFKQMVGGSSPLKIILFYGITILHLVFEYLAFSSDINFWRSKTSFEGLSSSSVTMQACMNIIMFLYVKEQQQTKFVMYFIGFRFCLNLWKLRKLTTVRFDSRWPYLQWENRKGASTSMEELQEVAASEQKCMFWLFALLAPLMLGFSIYRLIFHCFRSWYSWMILTLAIGAQTCGFVVMTPQVFMNYRLKSVEHLPWRVLTYQAINTFIDDVFMLCIRMPELQKYSVFRDDIIFIICCVQRWLYKKDRGNTVGAASDTVAGDDKKND